MLLIAVSNLCFSMLSRRVISRKIKYRVSRSAGLTMQRRR